MTDWVHCNSCYKQPGSNRQFHLTNCGHIYCEECVIQVKKTKCNMCGNQCTTILLAAKMKPDVEIFFTDPVDLWKKQFKKMQKIIQVMEFQKNHRSRLAVYSREQYSKQNYVMTKTQRSLGQVRDLEREIMVLKEENSYMKKLLSGKGSASGRTPPIQRSPVGTGASHLSPQGCSQASKMNFQQAHQQGHLLQSQNHGTDPGHVTKGPARVCVRTPPAGRFGFPKTPPPKGMDAGLPGVYPESRMYRSGVSPMDGSPMEARHYLQIPPTCMPITPNRPITPNYVTSCSPAATATSSQRFTEETYCKRRPIQLNYPLVARSEEQHYHR